MAAPVGAFEHFSGAIDPDQGHARAGKRERHTTGPTTQFEDVPPGSERESRPERDIAASERLRVLPVVERCVVVPAFPAFPAHLVHPLILRFVKHYWVRKKVHWSDTDAAGIAWFPNYFGWFEDAEEELYLALVGRTRQALLDELGFGMPRVEATAKYRAPVRAGQMIRIGIVSTLENPRRLRHDFEMRSDDSDALLAEGFVRVACVNSANFTPQDLPAEVVRMVEALPAAAERQIKSADLPWV